MYSSHARSLALAPLGDEHLETINY